MSLSAPRIGSRSGSCVVFFLSLLLLAAVPGAAQQGAVFRFETRHLDQPDAEPEIGTTRVQGKRLAMDLESEEGAESERTGILFDGEEDTFTYIDHERKTYGVMSLEQIKSMMQGMSAQLQAAMKQMEAQMANMPAEQREQMRKMMERQMGNLQPGGKERPPLRVERTGETQQVEGVDCRLFDVFRGEERIRQACVADWDDVDVPKDIFAVFEDLGNFFEEMMAELPSMPVDMESNPFVAFEELGGFPLLLRSFEDGEPRRETSLRLIERQELDSSTFEPPSGYEKIDPLSGR